VVKAHEWFIVEECINKQHAALTLGNASSLIITIIIIIKFLQHHMVVTSEALVAGRLSVQ